MTQEASKGGNNENAPLTVCFAAYSWKTNRDRPEQTFMNHQKLVFHTSLKRVDFFSRRTRRQGTGKYKVHAARIQPFSIVKVSAHRFSGFYVADTADASSLANRVVNPSPPTFSVELWQRRCRLPCRHDLGGYGGNRIFPKKSSFYTKFCTNPTQKTGIRSRGS